MRNSAGEVVLSDEEAEMRLENLEQGLREVKSGLSSVTKSLRKLTGLADSLAKAAFDIDSDGAAVLAAKVGKLRVDVTVLERRMDIHARQIHGIRAR